MKSMKHVILRLTAVCVMLTAFLCPVGVSAAIAPAAEHVAVKQTYSQEIEVVFAEGDYKIANLKSSSANLLLRTTYVSASSSKRSYDSEHPYGYAEISMYAKKKGTYTVTFDVIGRNQEVKSSHSVKVHADANTPVKKTTFNGSTNIYATIIPKAKGKFKVTMTKGYKLQSITMTTYNKAGKAVTKKIKNGASVTLGKYRRISDGNQSAGWENWTADLLARTEFQVTYLDKYTGEAKDVSYSLYRLPLN